LVLELGAKNEDLSLLFHRHEFANSQHVARLVVSAAVEARRNAKVQIMKHRLDGG